MPFTAPEGNMPTGQVDERVFPEPLQHVSELSGGALPQGWIRGAAPGPRAASSHSACVGSRPPSHTQKACAVAQLTQLIGWFSRPATFQLHSEYGVRSDARLIEPSKSNGTPR